VTSSVTSPVTSAVMSLPRGARPFVVIVNALYATAIVVGVLTTRETMSGLTSCAVLLACALVSIEGSLRLVWRGPKAGRSTNDLLAVWTIPVVLLLPPLYGAIVVVPIFAFLQLRVGKRPLIRLVFSISAAGLANFVAASLHRALVGDPTRWDLHSLVGTPGALTAIVVCVAVRHLINMGLVAEVMALTSATSSASRLRAHLVDPDAWVGITAESCTGVLVAVACAGSPYAVLFALAPVLVLQRTLLLAEFRDAARTDPKTGLANSSYWRDVAEREIKRARGGGEPLAVLIVDIDNFKLVNDKYGHLTGDDVLRGVANGLTDGLRPRDFVGRFGGEEFVILLAGSDLDQARQTAERVRAQVAEVSVPDGSHRERISVTVSVGVAAFRDNGHSVHELLDAADAALYAAKHAGRNCVRVAEGARQQVLDLTPHSHRLIDLRAQRESVD
jgi:diguanylate cyclase (GGDEF)-like protein